MITNEYLLLRPRGASGGDFDGLAVLVDREASVPGYCGFCVFLACNEDHTDRGYSSTYPFSRDGAYAAFGEASTMYPGDRAWQTAIAYLRAQIESGGWHPDDRIPLRQEGTITREQWQLSEAAFAPSSPLTDPGRYPVFVAWLNAADPSS